VSKFKTEAVGLDANKKSPFLCRSANLEKIIKIMLAFLG
jgi:hypothetical protein